jgi:uncharacterized Zn finger protein
MNDWSTGYPPYVPVAKRIARMKKQAARLAKKKAVLHPVQSRTRKIAATWWGQAWCRNLEAFSDYGNRLPRGRSYLSNGSVLDLAITPGRVSAQVAGSRLYQVTIEIKPLPPEQWQGIAQAVGGRLASLVELLEGRFSDAIMTVLTRPGAGLFPAPREIKLACDCPDWATMCKHVAATLYGVGVRLDDDPRLLFVLRRVDESDLIAGTAGAGALADQPSQSGLDLNPDELGKLFGIELAGGAGGLATVAPPPRPSGKAKAAASGRRRPAAARKIDKHKLRKTARKR